MSLLYDIIIAPIESIVEMVFTFSFVKFSKFGVAGAIIAVSLAINFLALPLYNIADELQLRERNIQNKMADRLKKIKAAFSGNERFMITQTYYRMNNYNPLYALRSSLSILIEIPFFIAAYHFLSHCPALENQSIWILKDLSAPDGLIFIPLFSGVNINLLPILMTLINCISSFVYTKGAPIREKIQVYGLAIVFLAILYNSPSGLVFYWILNNLFSLLKNIVQKMKHSGKILHAAISLILIFACVYIVLYFPKTSRNRKAVACLLTTLFILSPLIISCIKRLFEKGKIQKLEYKNSFLLFICSAISLCLLSGFLLPSNVVATSPTEFSFLGATDSPLTYVKTSTVFFFGIFVFWPFCIYKMFGDKVKKGMTIVFFVTAVCAYLNAFVFKFSYGTLNVFFSIDNTDCLKEKNFFFSVLPMVSVVATLVLVYFIIKIKKERMLAMVMLGVCVASFVVGIKNTSKIKYEYKEFAKSVKNEKPSDNLTPIFNLSRDKQNVIVLFYDRMIPSFLPYIFEQFPEIEKDFSGFTFYPNCVSLGGSTIIGTPGMVGGYDYGPENMNARSSEKLVKKHNEAFNVIPEILSSLDYDTVLSNPPFVNYSFGINDEGFSTNKKIKIVNGENANTVWKYKQNHIEDFEVEVETDFLVKKAINSFSLMQIIYPLLRFTLHQAGHYYRLESNLYGGSDSFVESYAPLYYLSELTTFENDNPEYAFFGCDTTHEYTPLLAPDYRPGVITKDSVVAGTGNYQYRDNSSGENDFDAYHVNAATVIQTAKYLNYLKENGVYDNTRIIIVSDHGRGIYTPAFGDKPDGWAKSSLNATLMFKDFNSSGELQTDNKFMTNAETINLVLKDMPVEMKNPFTGNPIKSVDDFEDIHIYNVFGTEWNAPEMKNKNQFTLLPQNGWQVKENIFDDNNWIRLDRVGK